MGVRVEIGNSNSDNRRRASSPSKAMVLQVNGSKEPIRKGKHHLRLYSTRFSEQTLVGEKNTRVGIRCSSELTPQTNELQFERISKGNSAKMCLMHVYSLRGNITACL